MTVTMKEVARRAGVTRPVVSAVLGGSSTIRVAPATRRKILKLVTELDFVPNLAARQLKGASNRLVGLVTVPSHLGLMALLQADIITILQSHGYEVLTAQLAAGEDAARVIREFRARRVSGVVALGSKPRLTGAGPGSIPAVYCSHTSTFGFDVGCDIRLGGYLAARHLLEHGRRRLAYLGMQKSVSDTRKYEGVCRALKEAGRPRGAGSLLIAEGGDVKTILSHVKTHRTDALVCCNDFAAAEMLKLLGREGIRVPGEMAVTGFDGYSFCKYTPVSLATVVQPVTEQAQRTVALLLERIAAGRAAARFSQIELPPVFVPGGSCGCPEAHSETISGGPFIRLGAADAGREPLS